MTLGEVFENVLNLIQNKGPGPDDIPAKILVNCVYSLSRPIYLLFKLSLESGVFPEQWKYSFVTPIFKSGNQSDAKNYRPISILGSIPKLLEKIVCDHIKSSVMLGIGQEQHGFCKGRSTATNMITFTQTVLGALESGCQVDAVYTDFSKAFDTVNHRVLAHKLECFGFAGTLLKWLVLYISNRKQFVKVKGFVSQEISVTSGVPQGSHLGPYLFNIFINDLRQEIRFSQPLFFADDLKLFAVVNSFEDTVKIQDDLNRVCEWYNKNMMVLNIKKCKIITFTRIKRPLICDYSLNNNILERVTTIYAT